MTIASSTSLRNSRLPHLTETSPATTASVPITTANATPEIDESNDIEEDPRTMTSLLQLVLSDIHNDDWNPEYLRVTAPSPELASEALLHHFRWLVNGVPLPTNFPPNTLVRNAKQPAMSTSFFRVTM